MINYIYDGSFEGLLTAVYEAYYRHETPQKILSLHNIQECIFDENIHIQKDLAKSAKVYNSIKEKISDEALKNVFHTYLSEHEDAGTWIFEYLKFGWKVGSKVDLYLSDERVLRIHNTCYKVTGECHRMLGMLRFKQLEEKMFYAAMEPDNNITALMAPHFVQRMSDQSWIIHDLKRNIAALYDQNKWILTNISLKLDPAALKEELDYQNLWKQYFKSIAIKNRLNPRLQRQHMPVRYWKHLVEK